MFFLQAMTNNIRFMFSVGDDTWAVFTINNEQDK